MPRAIRICKACGGKFVEYRTFRGPGGTQRGKEWEITAAATPGLCNDCKLTVRHQAMSESAGDHDYGDEIVALDLPALKGDTDWQTRRAESLRRRFFEDKGNLRLAKLLRSAPQVYESVSREKQDAMMAATRKSGWGGDFAGAFAYANANLPKSHHEEVLGERFGGTPQEYIRILRVMLSETDAKTIIVTLLR